MLIFKKIMACCILIAGNVWFDNNGRYPLHYAVYNEDIALIEDLLAMGADIHAYDSRWHTPLDYAINYDLVDVARILLNAATDLDMHKEHYAQVWLSCIQQNQIEMARLLSQGWVDIEYKGTIEEQGPALHIAVENNYVDLVKLLLRAGANVQAKNSSGSTPLHYANSAEVAQLLIQAGANVQAKNKYGSTPLHYAKSAEVAQLLIQVGANVQAKNKYGSTPLHYDKSAEVAKVLIDCGADIEIKDEDGDTPLYSANAEVAQLLLDAGAYDNGKRKEYSTSYTEPILDYDNETNFCLQEIAQGFENISYDINFQNIFERAIQIDHVDLFKKILDAYAQLINSHDSIEAIAKKYNLLYLIIQYDASVIFKFMLQHGIDVNYSKDDNGRRSLLHRAASRNNDKNVIVPILIKAGADVNMRDFQGNTPLALAVYSGEKLEVVRSLLDAGADPNAKNYFGCTPLHLLLSWGNSVEVAKMLLQAGADPLSYSFIYGAPLYNAPSYWMRKLLMDACKK